MSDPFFRLEPLELPPVGSDAWVDLPGCATLFDCPQDPEWHAEGDVGVHTRMVLDALVADPDWQTLPPDEQEDCWLACLWHDIAKPLVTREEDGRIRSPGHSRRGAVIARVLAWRAGLPPERRERIAHLVALHQVPFFAMDRDDPERSLALLSHVVRLDLLALVNRADGRGRTCVDAQRLADANALFALGAEELGCLRSPYPFPSDHARVLAWTKERPLLAPAWDDRWGEVVILSGLPAAGKDTWLRERWDGPVVSLDALRAELGVSPGDDQGPVIREARERAKQHLRAKQPFAWNATNLSRDLRDRVVNLAMDYGAAVRFVCAEASLSELLERNGARDEPVPVGAIERMLRRWEAPTRLEGHRLERVGP